MFDRRAYLLDVSDRCPNLRTMQELVDILARFGYNEFYLHDAAPSREVPLDTAKTAAYCAMQGIEFRAVGAEGLRALETDADTVTAPTFAARSLCGRIEEMRVAMERAEEVGRARKAERFLVTDLSDGYAWHPGITQFVLDDVSAVARGARIALERWLDRSDWAKEISYAALLLECACHRRDERRLREARDMHGHVWRMRFEPEGRVESLSRLPRF